VTKFTNGSVKFLTAGDIEKVTEEKILRLGIDVSADIFKLNHHGLQYKNELSNNSDFVKAVNPKYSYVQFTENNKWSYKYKAIKTSVDYLNMSNYYNIRSNMYNTDVNGNIQFVIRNNKRTPIAEKGTYQVKINYVDPIFDLYYYISENDIGDKDPIIHYIEDGFRLKMPFNRKYPNFLTNLDDNVHVQLDKFANDRIKKELKNNRYITNSKVLIDYIVTQKEFNTGTIKVGVFLEDNYDNMNACPYIRVHTPFSKLAKSGDYHFFVYGQEIMPLLDIDNMINAHIFDVIVIQRVNPYSNVLLKKA